MPLVGEIRSGDNRNSEQSEGEVCLIVPCGVIADAVGVNRQSEILHTLTTRATFGADPPPRIRFVYTPKHARWVTHGAVWFGILVRRMRNRCTFPSRDDLRYTLLGFIAYFNHVLRRPFRWLYTGRP